MPGEVTLTCTLGKESLPATGQPQLAYVLMEVAPAEVMANVQMPVNLCLVLDKSGSMAGAKLGSVKQAVERVVNSLSTEDRIAVVAFDGRPRTIVAGTQVRTVADKQKVLREVARIDADDGTEIAPALAEGLKQIQGAAGGNLLPRLILLTDGQTEHEDRCKREAEKAGQAGVPVVALGFGDDWNEKLLIELANLGAPGGGADYIASPDDVVATFQGALQSAQAAVVQNAELVLRLVAGISPRKIWRVVPTIADLGIRPLSDRVVAVSLGELEKGQGQALLVELMLPARTAGNYRIAQAEVSYDVPLLRLVQEKVRADVMMAFTYDPAQAAQANPRVMNIVEKVTAFKLQTRALESAERGDVANATQQLRAAHTILLGQGDTELAKTVKLAADQLEQQQGMSSDAKKTIQFKSGKTVRLTPPDA